MRLRPPALLLTPLLTLTLGTTLAFAPSAGATDTPPSPGRKSAEVKAAKKALADAEAAVAGGSVEEGGARDQTLAMRDLFVS
jgi:hypothetical protein